MDELDQHEWVAAYARLKKQKTDLDNELSRIRSQIVEYCEQRQLSEFESGNYRVKLIQRERKDYDDQKLYAALPDPEVWRMISKADAAKIASIVKLNVLTHDMLRDTYTVKRVPILQVENVVET